MGKINICDNIMIKNQEKIEIKNKSPSEISFSNRIHSLLKQADARKSADIIYLICDTSLVCGSGLVI